MRRTGNDLLPMKMDFEHVNNFFAFFSVVCRYLNPAFDMNLTLSIMLR